MLGAWGLTYLLSKNKPRTFSTPRLISYLLKEKGLKVPHSGTDYANNPIWQNNWKKFKKTFENKNPTNIWNLGIDWTKIKHLETVNISFVENCQKFEKEKITTEADPKYEAIIEFCADKE